MASEPMSASSSVYPSGGDLATKSAPTFPVAPGLFSTITGWPSADCSPGESARARMSEVPPGGYGTMILIVLVGQACANAAPARASVANARNARRSIDVIWESSVALLDAARVDDLFPAVQLVVQEAVEFGGRV